MSCAASFGRPAFLLDANPLTDIRNLTRRGGGISKTAIDAGLDELARRNGGRCKLPKTPLRYIIGAAIL